MGSRPFLADPSGCVTKKHQLWREGISTSARKLITDDVRLSKRAPTTDAAECQTVAIGLPKLLRTRAATGHAKLCDNGRLALAFKVTLPRSK
jgi:hypothetical protein